MSHRYHIHILARVTGLIVALAACRPEATDPGSRPEPGTGDEAAQWAAERRTEVAAGGEDLGEDATPTSADFPCTVIDQAAIENLLGNTTEPPAWTLEDIDDGVALFQAETCSWLTFAEGANEITLQVSRREHFDGGRISCWQPAVDEDEDVALGLGGDVDDQRTALSEEVVDGDAIALDPIAEEIADLGSTAWWIYDPEATFGSLQVCHPRARIAVEVSAPSDSDARRAAVDLARRALAGLSK